MGKRVQCDRCHKAYDKKRQYRTCPHNYKAAAILLSLGIH